MAALVNFDKPGANGAHHLKEIVVQHRRASKDAMPTWATPDKPTIDQKLLQLDGTGYLDHELELLRKILRAAHQVRSTRPRETNENNLRDALFEELTKPGSALPSHIWLTRENPPGPGKQRIDLGVWIKQLT